MAKERILIAVKTYPTLSNKYIELVCTAGFREDGSWIRIYPSPFRFLEQEQKYVKYQWIDADLGKNPSDSRPESYRPINVDEISLGHKISTENEWKERRKLILEKNTIYTNLEEIIRGAKRNEFSLAIFKPAKIIDFISEPAEREWKISRKRAAEESLKQGSLFNDTEKPDHKLVPKLPYKFSYRFNDDVGKSSKLMIEDWEIGQLYWNCVRRYDEATAVQKVKEKYLDDFARTKDLYLFLGTTYQHHMRKSRNPYVIIGTFHPPFQKPSSQLDLF